jgi:hypothetical protein
MIYPFSYEFSLEFQIIPQAPVGIGFTCGTEENHWHVRMKNKCGHKSCAYIPAITVCNQKLYTPKELKEWNPES